MDPKFDINTLKKELEVFLSKHSIIADASEAEHKRGALYTIKTSEATISITLGSKWVGYELDISKAIFGKSISISSDTDNYSLEEQNGQITRAIFNEALLYAQALIKKNIYVGEVGATMVVVLPQVDSNSYRIIYKKRFTQREEIVEKSHLQDMANLRALE